MIVVMLPKMFYKMMFLLAYTNKFPFLDYRRNRDFLEGMRARAFADHGMIETTVDGSTLDLDVRQWVDLLCWLGRFERAEQSFLRSAIRPGTVVFDVGANIGVYTLMFARLTGPTGKVYAFEPSPRAFERLQHTVSKNNLQQVIVERFALGREEAHLPLNVTGDLGFSSFGVPVEGAAISEQHSVSVTTLDAYCSERGIEAIDLLKMDVEGYELHVLGGAIEMVERRSIREMVIEYNLQAQMNNGFGIPDLVDSIRAHGFDVSAIGESGREPFIFTEDIEYAVLHCQLKQ